MVNSVRPEYVKWVFDAIMNVVGSAPPVSCQRERKRTRKKKLHVMILILTFVLCILIYLTCTCSSNASYLCLVISRNTFCCRSMWCKLYFIVKINVFTWSCFFLCRQDVSSHSVSSIPQSKDLQMMRLHFWITTVPFEEHLYWHLLLCAMSYCMLSLMLVKEREHSWIAPQCVSFLQKCQPFVRGPCLETVQRVIPKRTAQNVQWCLDHWLKENHAWQEHLPLCTAYYYDSSSATLNYVIFKHSIFASL